MTVSGKTRSGRSVGGETPTPTRERLPFPRQTRKSSLETRVLGLGVSRNVDSLNASGLNRPPVIADKVRTLALTGPPFEGDRPLRMDPTTEANVAVGASLLNMST